jgi:signal peptidase II
LLDFITKFLIIHFFNVNEGITLINNFLKFIYIKNTGAAFGLLNNNIYILIIITIALIVYLIYELIKCKNKFYFFSYLLILCGALGNLIDRVFRGYVVDFISFTLFGREMAIFNVADIYITFGVILFIFSIFKEGKHERNNHK